MGLPREWASVQFVPYYAWNGSILRSVLHAQRPCSAERVMPAGYPQVVPYLDELEAGTRLDRRGELLTDLDDDAKWAAAEEKKRY